MESLIFKFFKVDSSHFGGLEKERRRFGMILGLAVLYILFIIYLSFGFIVYSYTTSAIGYDGSQVIFIGVLTLGITIYYKDVITKFLNAQPLQRISIFPAVWLIRVSSFLLLLLLLWPLIKASGDAYSSQSPSIKNSIERLKATVFLNDSTIRIYQDSLNYPPSDTLRNDCKETLSRLQASYANKIKQVRSIDNQIAKINSKIDSLDLQKVETSRDLKIADTEGNDPNRTDSLSKLLLNIQTTITLLVQQDGSLGSSVSKTNQEIRALNNRIEQLNTNCKQDKSKRVRQDSISASIIKFHIDSLRSGNILLEDSIKHNQRLLSELLLVNSTSTPIDSPILIYSLNWPFVGLLLLSTLVVFIGNYPLSKHKEIMQSDFLKSRAEKMEDTNTSETDRTEEVNVNRSLRYRLTGLELKQMDIFKTVSWSLQPQVNILLGKNGYGKTHLIRLIIAMLTDNQKELKRLYKNQHKEQSALLTLKHTIKPSSEKASSEIRFSKRILNSGGIGKLPILAIPDLRSITRSDYITQRNDGYEDLTAFGGHHVLFRKPYISIIENMLVKLGEEMNSKEEDEGRKQLLEKVIFALSDYPFCFKEAIKQPTSSLSYQLMAQTEGSTLQLPLNVVSQGTLSILAVFGLIYDFLNSLAVHQLKATKPEDVSAVIIIDEVDAHLHPGWQQKIVNLLIKYFPSVQFILTAHSPLVVGGRKEKEVAVLRENREDGGFTIQQYQEDFLGKTVADIYDSVFKVLEFDPESSKELLIEENQLKKEIADLEKKKGKTKKEREKLIEYYDLLIELQKRPEK